jgi:hypothetical protein
VVNIALINANRDITVYPSVITGNTINMHWKEQPKGVYGILLLNDAGQVVLKTQLLHNGGSSFQTVKIDKQLNAGRYTIVLIKPDKSKTTNAILIGAK